MKERSWWCWSQLALFASRGDAKAMLPLLQHRIIRNPSAHILDAKAVTIVPVKSVPSFTAFEELADTSEGRGTAQWMASTIANLLVVVQNFRVGDPPDWSFLAATFDLQAAKAEKQCAGLLID